MTTITFSQFFALFSSQTPDPVKSVPVIGLADLDLTEEVVTCGAEAEARAVQDYDRVRGKRIEVRAVWVRSEYETVEYHAPEGKPFVVQIARLTGYYDFMRWSDLTHLCPFWAATVVEDHGLLPPTRTVWVRSRAFVIQPYSS